MLDFIFAKLAGTLSTQVIGKGECLQIPGFASPSQCRDWAKIILNNRCEWIERFEGAWSYGNAWYFDIEAGEAHRYFANAQNSNRLISKLPGYLDLMRESIQYILGPDGRLCLKSRARHENLGPYWCESGLHILQTDFDVCAEVGCVHQDIEGLIPYPHLMFAESTSAYSAILSVMVPEGRGGLNVWKTRFTASNEFPDLNDDDKVEFDYQIGTMTIIDSFMPHQIQDMVCSMNNPFRISGVMHFLYRTDPYPHWEYWF